MATRKILYLPPEDLSASILSEQAREILNSLGSVIWNELGRNYTADELMELLPGADAVVTSWGSPVFTPEMVKQADNLKIVGHAAGTVKQLMPQEGHDKGIVVLSAAKEIAKSVAEYTLWAMLHFQRNVYHYDHLLKVERGWKAKGREGFGHTLYRKKVGIVSASMVGRQVINLLAPFGCDIMVFDPYLSDEDAANMGVKKGSLEDVFSKNEIISNHAPITPETKKMISAAHIASIPDGTLFVHTARTWVMDQDALVEELKKNRFFAVLDVFEPEPLPADHPVRDLDNVFLSPHISGHTVEGRFRLVESIAEDIVRFFNDEPLELVVPPEKLKIMA
ncbi:MAG: hydroxyacid dehydrogenase [Chloroflexota bacterium]